MKMRNLKLRPHRMKPTVGWLGSANGKGQFIWGTELREVLPVCPRRFLYARTLFCFPEWNLGMKLEYWRRK